MLRDRLDHTVGRHRSLSVEGLLVAMQVNGLRRHHQATLAEVARVLNSFTDTQREHLGIRNWKPTQAYDRADQLFNLLNGELESYARHPGSHPGLTSSDYSRAEEGENQAPS